jgi:hypothetical protein
MQPFYEEAAPVNRKISSPGFLFRRVLRSCTPAFPARDGGLAKASQGGHPHLERSGKCEAEACEAKAGG